MLKPLLSMKWAWSMICAIVVLSMPFRHGIAQPAAPDEATKSENLEGADPTTVLLPATNKPISSDAIGMLQLTNGDIYRGQIAHSISPEADGGLAWQCPAFASDLYVPWHAVDRLSQPKAFSPPPATAEGIFVVELGNGETISGRIVDFNDQQWTMESPRTGRISIDRSSIASVLRTGQLAESTGALRHADWRQLHPNPNNKSKGKWTERLGAYETESSGTSIIQNVNIPELAAIDLQVGWESPNPNWMLTIGDPRRVELHVRKIEARNHLAITLLCEEESEADIHTANLPVEGVTNITLRLLCDAARGRLALMHGGVPIATLQMKKKLPITNLQRLMFTNHSLGRVSLRELKVQRSVFSVPVLMGQENAPTLQIAATETLLASGETFVGVPKDFDPATRTFSISGADTLGRLSLDQVDRMEFPTQRDLSSPHLYVVELADGERFVGKSIQAIDKKLLVSTGFRENPIEISCDEIRSIAMHGIPPKPEPPSADQPESSLLMRFTSNWAVTTGYLHSVSSLGNDQPIKSLVWKPRASEKSLRIDPKVTGVIEPLLGGDATAQPKPQVPKGRTTVRVINNPNPSKDYGRTLLSGEPSLFLANGDCFPAELVACDEEELVFKSTSFAHDRIATSEIRGIRVLAYEADDKFEKGSRKRLLTLPRIQRNNPPTHLIISREGDALRGHLKSVNSDQAVIEVRGEDRTILMKNVAEVIWLPKPPPVVPPKPATQEDQPQDQQASTEESEQQEESDPAENPSDEALVENDTNEPKDLVCQILFGLGTRISMVPEQVEDGILRGQHPQLGACQIDLRQVSKIVLGDNIQSDAQKNRFGKWRLENAPDPKFVNDLDSTGGEGSDDPNSAHAKMVGQPAPSFTLDKLDGGKLSLKELKGRIVVLDFWATWCGPCVASLPKVAQMTKDYQRAEVDVLTINIQQRPEEIKALMTRLGIAPNILLDSDGEVARAYQANSIPQTVIIDRSGKVKRIIVGGGDATEAQIRDTIDSMLDLKL